MESDTSTAVHGNAPSTDSVRPNTVVTSHHLQTVPKTVASTGAAGQRIELPTSSEKQTAKEIEKARIERAIARREERKRQQLESTTAAEKARKNAEQHSSVTVTPWQQKPVNALTPKHIDTNKKSEMSEPLGSEEKRKTQQQALLVQETISNTPKQSASKQISSKQNVIDINDCEACEQSIGRPVAYHIANTESDPRIFNFDQGITERFKTKGSYLDKGLYKDNVVKDKSGRGYLNVMALWDVLVESLDNGEKRYYGNIQFPLGSRHPVIIKSVKSGDQLELGCKADEVIVLKALKQKVWIIVMGCWMFTLRIQPKCPMAKTPCRKLYVNRRSV